MDITKETYTFKKYYQDGQYVKDPFFCPKTGVYFLSDCEKLAVVDTDRYANPYTGKSMHTRRVTPCNAEIVVRTSFDCGTYGYNCNQFTSGLLSVLIRTEDGYILQEDAMFFLNSLSGTEEEKALAAYNHYGNVLDPYYDRVEYDPIFNSFLQLCYRLQDV